jgi:ribonuclease Z
LSARTFTALGTASQVPTRRRNHHGAFLRWDDAGILFDPGEGTQRQMLFFGVAASDIHLVCITHLHGDHCLGLAGVLQRMSLDRVPHTVHLFYPASGERYIDHLEDASIYLRTTRIARHPLTQSGVVHRTARFALVAEPLDHTVESWGYRLEEPDGVTLLPERLAALGVTGPDAGRLRREGAIEVGGRRVTLAEASVPKRGGSFAFVMDTRPCAGALALARGVDTLVCESTFLESETAEAATWGHMTAAQAATLARDAGAGRLVLTHFSQRYQDPAAFVREAAPIHADVMALEDGMVVPLARTAKG